MLQPVGVFFSAVKYIKVLPRGCDNGVFEMFFRGCDNAQAFSRPLLHAAATRNVVCARTPPEGQRPSRDIWWWCGIAVTTFGDRVKRISFLGKLRTRPSSKKLRKKSICGFQTHFRKAHMYTSVMPERYHQQCGHEKDSPRKGNTAVATEFAAVSRMISRY